MRVEKSIISWDRWRKCGFQFVNILQAKDSAACKVAKGQTFL